MFKTSSRTRQNEQLTRCRLGSIMCRLYLRLCREHSVLHGYEATCPFVSVATCPFLLQLASVSVVLVLSLSWQRFIASRIFFKHSNENARPFLSFKCITLHFEFKKRHRLPERVYIQRILVRKRSVLAISALKRSLYQDRLGTNIGKTQKKSVGSFLRCWDYVLGYALLAPFYILSYLGACRYGNTKTNPQEHDPRFAFVCLQRRFSNQQNETQADDTHFTTTGSGQT